MSLTKFKKASLKDKHYAQENKKEEREEKKEVKTISKKKK